MPEPERDIQRIAVLRANAVGDFVFALPALAALRAAYPHAEITLLGAPWHAGFLRDRPGPIDRVVVVPPLPGIRDPAAGEAAPSGSEEAPSTRAAFFTRAMAYRFDLAIQLHGGGRHSNPFVAGLGARLTCGLRSPDAPPLDRWVRYVYYQPEVFRYLEVVELVGAAPVTYRPALELTEQDRVEVKRLLGEADRPRVVLHPGASDPRRRWPVERFSTVGDALAQAGAQVLVTGVAAERDLVEGVVAGMRGPARALVDEVSLGGLAALFSTCAVVVGNDSGPVHLAEAVGAGTVGLYWIGNFINGAPATRTRHRPMISWRLNCPECGRDCTRDLYPARPGEGCAHRLSFVDDIPAEEVREAALELLSAG
ncbi:MAG: glycosyltransferase family 9 protein [Micromonosporaceae bacterium]|nr:glycosyltransferase family 9 protein [Micromonosporaceae bacterium]